MHSFTLPFGFTLRRAGTADADALSDLAIRSKATWGYARELMEIFIPELRLPPSYLTDAPVFVLEKGRQPIGFVGLSTPAAERELVFLFIDPAYLKSGFGTFLWKRGVQAAEELGWESFVIHVDPNAETFYTRQGARRVGDKEFPSGSGRRVPSLVYDVAPKAHRERSAEDWMAYALELAREAVQHDEVPVGALFVHEQRVLGAAFNLRETSKRTAAHAEIEALSQFNARFQQWRLPRGTTLYVTAEPCLMCTGALLNARLDHISYGCADPKEAGLERVWPLIEQGQYDHKFLTKQGGLLKEHASQVLSDYFRRKRPRNTTNGL